MKKFNLLVLTLLVLFGFASLTVNAAALTENAPVIGVDNPDTDFYSHWQPGSFGVNRTGDTRIDMALTSGYGLRAGFETPYNPTDFEMSLDLEFVDPNVVVSTFFGPQGSYIDGNGATLSMEILKHTTEAHKYLVAIQLGSGTHHVGFEETVVAEQGDWEDNAWVGYQLVAEDDVVTIELKDNGDETSTITINGSDFAIQTSKLYGDMLDNTSQYLLIGSMNLDGSIQTVTSNYIYDAVRREYHSETGVYTKFVNNLTALETALLEDLSVIANVEAAQALKAEMDETLLYSWDQSYLDDRYNAAYLALNTAEIELGGDIVINSYETQVTTFEAAVASITNYTSATQAITLEDSTLVTYNGIDTTEFTLDQDTRLAALSVRYDDAKILLYQTVESLITAQVSDYTASVSDLSTIDLIKSALSIKETLETALLDFVSVDVKTLLETQINNNNIALEATSEINDSWNVLGSTYTVDQDDELMMTFLGSALNSENGIFYTDSKLDVRDFSMTIDPLSFKTETGGWFSFGLMEQTEIFSNADDISVQENKGLFFLVIPNEDDVTARVEIYLMSLYCNRFFDAILTETLTIDITQEFDVVISTEMIKMNGITDEYMSITIAGQKLTNDLITTRAMKTALSDYQGYLYLAAQSSSSDNNITLNIKNINGVSVFADSLYVEYFEVPTSTASDLEYQLESSEAVTFNFDARDEAIISVKIDDKVLTTEEYTYLDEIITLRTIVLETLTTGEYTVTVATDGGAITVDLSILDAIADDVPEPTENTGNGISAWIYAVSGIAVVGVATVAIIFIKKK